MDEALPAQFKGKYHAGTGRRKTGTARVRLYEGKGQMTINDKPATTYLNPQHLLDMVMAPLVKIGMKDRFDISVKAMGGGPVSQAVAIQLGIARALVKMDESLKATLRAGGHLTRDPRAKERKKDGLKRARRGPQLAN